MDTFEIRRLISNDEIHKALKAIETLVDENSISECNLLSSQFSYWEKEKNAGLVPAIEVRNRIIYSILMIVSDLEKDSNSIVVSYKASISRMYEENIAKGYQKITDLGSDNLIDSFLVWLLDNHQAIFNKLIETDRSGFSSILAQLDVKNFTDDVEVEFINSILINKIKDDSNYLSKWLYGRLKKEKYVLALREELDRYRKQHQKLIFGGIGAVLGSLVYALIDLNIDSIDEKFEHRNIGQHGHHLDEDHGH